jgi:hypothetical protein
METKPKVAIYYFVVPQTGYRNDGCPLFITYNLRKLLDEKDAYVNHNFMCENTGNVAHFSPSEPITAFGKFDLHVLVDHGEDAIGVPLDWEIPHPNAYWVSDAHLGYKYRMERARQFDFVFVAQKRFIEEFVRDGIPREKIFWLPHAVEPMCYNPQPCIEKYDWAFVGHLNNQFRIDLLDRFCKEFPVGEKGYLGWRMPEFQGWNVMEDVSRKFSKARVILNENILDDINMRTFEAMGCKKALVTEWLPTLGELFQDKKHLMMYRNIEDAVAYTKELLADDNLRNAIAQAGYDEVISKHTYMHRVKTILKTCLDYSPALKEGLVKC